MVLWSSINKLDDLDHKAYLSILKLKGIKGSGVLQVVYEIILIPLNQSFYYYLHKKYYVDLYLFFIFKNV